MKRTEIEQQIINHYLQFITSTEVHNNGNQISYHVGDNFEIVVSKCDHDLSYKRDMMRLWHKAGFIKTMLPTHISVDTYYYDKDGNCWGLYNIMHALSADRRRLVIDFDYLREWTQDNINELVAECIRMRELDIRHNVIEEVTAC